MYLRPIHAENDIPTLRDLIKHVQLGVLVTAIPSPGADTPLIQSSHVPWVLHLEDERSETEYGVLRGHMAVPNPQAELLVANASEADGWLVPHEVMVLFTGDEHYISPQLYRETKPRTGKVVPTWNYASVAAYGRPRIYASANPGTAAFLHSQMHRLTEQAEAAQEYLPGQWTVSDAPERYVELLKKAVVGVEIRIERLEGKWKMSQEMGQGDRSGVVRGLEAAGEKGRRVAEVVRERGEKKA